MQKKSQSRSRDDLNPKQQAVYSIGIFYERTIQTLYGVARKWIGKLIEVVNQQAAMLPTVAN